MPRKSVKIENLSLEKYGGRVAQWAGRLGVMIPKKSLISKPKYVKRYIVLTSTHRLLFFTSSKDLSRKKAKLVVPIDRNASVVDINNHQGHKNTFGVKVKLTDPLRSKWGLKKSKDEFATIWMYGKTDDIRHPWVEKLKAHIQDLMEGSKRLSPEAVEAVQQGKIREVNRLLNEFEMHKDAVVHLPVKARRRVSNAADTSPTNAPRPAFGANTLSVPGSTSSSPLSVSPRSPLDTVMPENDSTAGSLPISPRRSDGDELESEDDDYEEEEDEDEDEDEFEDDEAEQVEQARAREAANILKMMELGVSHQDTMLIIAARHGHLDIVQKLLERNTDANKFNADGQTALHAAFEAPENRDTIVQALLDHEEEENQIDMNVQDKKNGFTPLVLAAKNDESKIVEKLIMRGANAKLVARDGMTAMHYLVVNGDLANVKLMMKRMIADPMARTYQGMSVCDAAAQALSEKNPNDEKRIQVLSELLRPLTGEGKFSLSDGYYDLAPLYLRQCIVDNLGMHIFQEILERDVKGYFANYEFVHDETRDVLAGGLVPITEKVTITTTPLILAIEHMRVDLVKHLLETSKLQVDVNKVKTEITGEEDKKRVVEYTAFGQTLASKTDDIIELFLSRDDVNMLQPSGPDERIPALLVIQHMSSERVRNLVFDKTPLEEEIVSSSTNASDDNETETAPPPEVAAGLARLKRTEQLVGTIASKKMGYTMFHIAAENNDVDTLRFLIGHGIEPRMSNKLNMTAVASACLYDSMDALEYLIQEIELEVTGSGHEPCVEHGWPPIHAAVLSGHRSPIKYLINNGNVDIDYAPSEKHKRPIHLACMRGFLNVVQYLMHYKVNLDVFVDTTDDKGLTPLHLAAAYNFHELVEYIADQGVIDMDHKTSAGYTALDLSMRRGNLKVVKALCDRGAGSDELTLQLAIQTGNATVVEWVERSKEIRRTKSMQLSRTDSITST